MKQIKEIRSEIVIEAPSEKVWSILMKFDAYSDWNPFIQNISGDAKVNEKLRTFLKPPDAKGMKFKPRVVKVEKGREFRWLGHLFFPGIFDGEHIFEIIDQGKQTVFVQREEFKGLFSSLILKNIGSKTQKGFEGMNSALKKLAEKKMEN